MTLSDTILDNKLFFCLFSEGRVIVASQCASCSRKLTLFEISRIEATDAYTLVSNGFCFTAGDVIGNIQWKVGRLVIPTEEHVNKYNYVFGGFNLIVSTI